MASAEASAIARARWPRPWPSVRPANTPRALGLPERRALTGQVRQEDQAVGPRRRCGDLGEEILDRDAPQDAVAVPVERPASVPIAAPTLNRPASGAGVTNAPGTSTGRSQYTPKPPAEPPGS